VCLALASFALTLFGVYRGSLCNSPAPDSLAAFQSSLMDIIDIDDGDKTITSAASTSYGLGQAAMSAASEPISSTAFLSVVNALIFAVHILLVWYW